jgi:alkanesulfonate monooxygenase SsuD/methylene tetrahydromethanopterin reductase-like flavin-dependent oxidoreductase (luciferase family)
MSCREWCRAAEEALDRPARVEHDGRHSDRAVAVTTGECGVVRNDELAIYLLPGGAVSPRPILDEVTAGEDMGLGTAFIAERFNIKEVCALSGAAAAESSSIRIATGVTNHNIRDHAAPLGRTLRARARARARARDRRRGEDDQHPGGATTEQLEHVATLLPDDRLAPAATGSPEQCASAIRDQLDLGCAGVIMHGATPGELRPIVEAYRGPQQQ